MYIVLLYRWWLATLDQELLYFLLLNSNFLISEEQQTLTSKVREEAEFEKFGGVMWVKLPHT